MLFDNISRCDCKPNMFGGLFNKLGGAEAGYGQPRTRAQTLQEHASALRELKVGLAKDAAHHFPMGARAKPFCAKVPRLASCSPILVQQLEKGVTHRGYVLKGRVITEAIKAQSVQSVLEDANGVVVTVHMYNIPSLPTTTTTLKVLETAQKLLPKGQNLAIIDPFHKTMLDGTSGVRVDNPAEIVFLDVEGRPLRSAAEIESSEDPAPGWSRPVAKNPTVDVRYVTRNRPVKSKKSNKGKG